MRRIDGSQSNKKRKVFCNGGLGSKNRDKSVEAEHFYKLPPLNTDAEIQAWIAQRKARWPSKGTEPSTHSAESEAPHAAKDEKANSESAFGVNHIKSSDTPPEAAAVNVDNLLAALDGEIEYDDDHLPGSASSQKPRSGGETRIDAILGGSPSHPVTINAISTLHPAESEAQADSSGRDHDRKRPVNTDSRSKGKQLDVNKRSTSHNDAYKWRKRKSLFERLTGNSLE